MKGSARPDFSPQKKASSRVGQGGRGPADTPPRDPSLAVRLTSPLGSAAPARKEAPKPLQGSLIPGPLWAVSGQAPEPNAKQTLFGPPTGLSRPPPEPQKITGNPPPVAVSPRAPAKTLSRGTLIGVEEPKKSPTGEKPTKKFGAEIRKEPSVETTSTSLESSASVSEAQRSSIDCELKVLETPKKPAATRPVQKEPEPNFLPPLFPVLLDRITHSSTSASSSQINGRENLPFAESYVASEGTPSTNVVNRTTLSEGDEKFASLMDEIYSSKEAVPVTRVSAEATLNSFYGSDGRPHGGSVPTASARAVTDSHPATGVAGRGDGGGGARPIVALKLKLDKLKILKETLSQLANKKNEYDEMLDDDVQYAMMDEADGSNSDCLSSVPQKRPLMDVLGSAWDLSDAKRARAESYGQQQEAGGESVLVSTPCKDDLDNNSHDILDSETNASARRSSASPDRNRLRSKSPDRRPDYDYESSSRRSRSPERHRHRSKSPDRRRDYDYESSSRRSRSPDRHRRRSESPHRRRAYNHGSSSRRSRSPDRYRRRSRSPERRRHDGSKRGARRSRSPGRSRHRGESPDRRHDYKHEGSTRRSQSPERYRRRSRSPERASDSKRHDSRTDVCRYFKTGYCKRGSSCQFEHEARTSTPKKKGAKTSATKVKQSAAQSQEMMAATSAKRSKSNLKFAEPTQSMSSSAAQGKVRKNVTWTADTVEPEYGKAKKKLAEMAQLARLRLEKKAASRAQVEAELLSLQKIERDLVQTGLQNELRMQELQVDLQRLEAQDNDAQNAEEIAALCRKIVAREGMQQRLKNKLETLHRDRENLMKVNL